MIDLEMLEQLKGVFSRLEERVGFKVYTTDHADFSEFQTMLHQLISASPRLYLEMSSEVSDAPRLDLLRDGKPNGITFRGVPGGHEFSSLILSILYSDGKGKQPDRGMIDRIKNIKGPIKITTYVSLTCENCPEVVQALNLMASHHEDFFHETVDGGVAQEEVEALSVQGVPAVFASGKLIHSGKGQLVDLLTKVEQVFGISDNMPKEINLGSFEVAVVGGGPAGASSAIYSVRKGLSTVLIAEKLGGQLQETKGIENMISIPYTEGVRLSAQLAEHLGSYPVKILEHRRVKSISKGTVKRIDFESGEYLVAKSIIIATGAKWRELGIPGEKEHIGMGVAFCAHCDGPFYKGKKVAVVGGGNSGIEAAIDLASIATNVTVFEYKDSLKADGVLIEKLRALPNATIVTSARTSQVLGDGKKVVGLEYQDLKSGDLKTLEVDGVFVQIGLLPNTQFLKGFLELTPYGEIVVDLGGRTSVPGVYAAGDVTTIPFKQIVMAMGDGAKAALTAFEDRIHARV